MKNIPPNVIQSWSRWKLDAYRGYIRIKSPFIAIHLDRWLFHRLLGTEESTQTSSWSQPWSGVVWCTDQMVWYQEYEVEPTTDTHPARFKKLSLPPSQWRVTLGDETRPSLTFQIPNTTVVWSCILPRLFWYGARSQVAIDNVRGIVLTQSDLSDKETGCYRFDGIHLSDIGNDIYLNALQGALESFLIKDI
ncbi:hypothetical protein KUTeg_002456 [Tegillarca granosa]|uniref:Uncharacterized protein n=1 Tax=Tegillarca granosa TaxID=220873 RepID=A0ABQ9FUC3_TEGGR|nr:hypothetical protein KUTeg_002456 [Tegillarca granosa]